MNKLKIIIIFLLLSVWIPSLYLYAKPSFESGDEAFQSYIDFFEEVYETMNTNYYVPLDRTKFNDFITKFESKIYSQYPDAQVEEVSDYMDEIPPDVPSRDYDLWGADFVLVKKNWLYPLRTYVDYEDIEEERRIDWSELDKFPSRRRTGRSYISLYSSLFPTSGW